MSRPPVRRFNTGCPDCGQWRCRCYAECPDCGREACICDGASNIPPAPALGPVQGAAARTAAPCGLPAALVKLGPPPAHIRDRLAALRAECAAHLASLGRRV